MNKILITCVAASLYVLSHRGIAQTADCQDSVVQIHQAASVAEKIEAYRSLSQCLPTQPIHPKNFGGWTSAYGGCVGASRQWFLFAESHGIPLERVKITDGWVEDSQGNRSQIGSLHYFLVDRSLGTEIIVDPTYLQFLGGGSAPTELPSVFVGTPDDMTSLYLAYPQSLQWGLANGRRGQWNPRSFAERIYGLGDAASNRHFIGYGNDDSF